jgi:hypothetical protein
MGHLDNDNLNKLKKYLKNRKKFRYILQLIDW